MNWQSLQLKHFYLQIDIYRSITKDEIRDVANKYLNSNQRLVLDYLPGDEQNKTIIE